MKLVGKLLAALVGIFVLVMGIQMIASETGEVVVVTTQAADDTSAETRLWVVDRDGQTYLRAGSPAAGWYGRLVASPSITVERDGVAASYRAVSSPDDTSAVNELMAQKYGWADTYIGMIFSRDDSIAIRLDPPG